MIRPSSDLINKYCEISDFCHNYSEPVYITKNGQRDLVVMSIETYERIIGTFELYKLLDNGLEDIKNNKVALAEKIFEDVEKRILE